MIRHTTLSLFRDLKEKPKRRSLIQHIMAWGLPTIVLGGFVEPKIGLIAGAFMATSLVVSYWKSRFWCGWVCPRGSFLERWISFFTLNRPIPWLLLKPNFRWSVFSILMTLMLVRLTLAASTLDKVGTLFVMLCLGTTMVAITLGALYKPRTWCTFCPMETLQSKIGKIRKAN